MTVGFSGSWMPLPATASGCAAAGVIQPMTRMAAAVAAGSSTLDKTLIPSPLGCGWPVCRLAGELCVNRNVVPWNQQ